MDNKNIFAENLKKYMEEAGKTRHDVCQALGLNYYTFTSWVNGTKYPRMDKVEMLANYFGITKADLIEEKVTEEMKKNHGTIADAVIRMRTDAEFFDIVEKLLKMDQAALGGVRQLLDALQVFGK
jgi:repressor LexA